MRAPREAAHAGGWAMGLRWRPAIAQRSPCRTTICVTRNRPEASIRSRAELVRLALVDGVAV